MLLRRHVLHRMQEACGWGRVSETNTKDNLSTVLVMVPQPIKTSLLFNNLTTSPRFLGANSQLGAAELTIAHRKRGRNSKGL